MSDDQEFRRETLARACAALAMGCDHVITVSRDQFMDLIEAIGVGGPPLIRREESPSGRFRSNE